MRYYKILLTDANGKPVYLRSLNGNILTSLAPNGAFNPGALNVEMDIPINPFSTGDAAKGYVKVWGVGLEDIVRQADYNDLNIAIYGGMSRGLPLASPQQQGLLVQGTIWQSFGNWRGTEQSLIFVVGPSAGTTEAPINIPFTWQAGTPLATALANTFRIAFPNLKQRISISQNVTLGYTETGHYTALKPFAEWLNQRTQPIFGGDYQGVQIAINGGTICAWDGTQPPANIIKIDPWDLIGQPTWLSFNEINFQTVLRGAVNIGDTVQLPQTIISQTAASQSRFRDRTSFNGNLLVTKAQHFANFRQPDASSWNTTFWCAAAPAQGS